MRAFMILEVLIIISLKVFPSKSDESSEIKGNHIYSSLPSVFYTESLPNDLRFMPTLGNGHLGFTLFGSAIYLNGIYNGRHGLSHRARIPNYSNISIVPDSSFGSYKTSYNLNVKTGIFKIKIENNNLRIVQIVYAHRFYNRAIVNQIFIYRLAAKGALRINIRHQSGQRTEDIDFSEPTTITKSLDSSSVVDDQNRSQDNEETIHLIQGYTRELEDDSYQKSRKHVCCLWNHVPEEITLHEDQRSASYRFVMTADELCSVAKQEMTDVLSQPTKSLLKLHWSQWLKFWDSFSISVDGNTQLDRTIHGSIFYLASALPSFETNQPNNPFFGLSPSGLGRGGNDLLDYQGHNFWDTEIWMLPTVTQMDPRWTNQLLEYRYRMLNTAKDNARRAGYKGSRFPWESAFTGTEVTNPCCPLVAKQQFHITADIALALQHYFSVTYDLKWLCNRGNQLAENIAEFWASRVEFDNSTGFYDIKYVMGPDEDHPNVTNNVFTNAVASYALKFGEFAHSLCNSNDGSGQYSKNSVSAAWVDIANKLKIPYDTELDYHPQYEGYRPGEVIKQADVVLLGYPLLYPMNHSTRANDLKIYEDVTRDSGPAMTWAMHAINHLDTGNTLKAGELFERSYQNYVRSPFQVWSEVSRGKGAVNFLTGAGGFLQSLINGYAGVRFYLDYMEVHKPRVPPNANKFSISGVKYLGSVFKLTATNDTSLLQCTTTNPNQPLILVDDKKQQKIYTGLIYHIIASRIIIKTERRNFRTSYTTSSSI